MRKEKRKLSEAWMLVFCTLCVISASIATLFYFPLALLGCTCRSETISTGASPPAVYTYLEIPRFYATCYCQLSYCMALNIWLIKYHPFQSHDGNSMECLSPGDITSIGFPLPGYQIPGRQFPRQRPVAAKPTGSNDATTLLLFSCSSSLCRPRCLTRGRYSFLLCWFNLDRFSVDLYSARQARKNPDDRRTVASPGRQVLVVG